MFVIVIRHKAILFDVFQKGLAQVEAAAVDVDCGKLRSHCCQHSRLKINTNVLNIEIIFEISSDTL